MQFEDDDYQSEYDTLPGQMYLRMNCLSECRRQWLIELCNCSLDFMYPFDNTTKCKISDFDCFHKFGRKFNYEKPPENNQYFPDKSDGLECKCLPECERVDYDVELSPLRRM